MSIVDRFSRRANPPSPASLAFLLLSVGIVVAYAVARSIVYKLYPITTTSEWVFRDAIMDIPRLLCFGAALLLLRRFQNSSTAREWTSLKPVEILVIGALPILLWNYYFSQSSGDDFSPPQIVLGVLSSVAVALFEETAFRGAVFASLRQRCSNFTTVFGTSLLFTLFHLQAQSTERWISIFLTGLVFANLRARGLTLAGLALIHATIDSLFFLHPSNNPESFSKPDQALTFGLLVMSVLLLPSRQRTVRISADFQ
jgi:membrane protease YdiL (CAAX protease family)